MIVTKNSNLPIFSNKNSQLCIKRPESISVLLRKVTSYQFAKLGGSPKPDVCKIVHGRIK